MIQLERLLGSLGFSPQEIEQYHSDYHLSRKEIEQVLINFKFYAHTENGLKIIFDKQLHMQVLAFVRAVDTVLDLLSPEEKAVALMRHTKPTTMSVEDWTLKHGMPMAKSTLYRLYNSVECKLKILLSPFRDILLNENILIKQSVYYMAHYARANESEYLTRRELATILHTSTTTVDRWRKEGMPFIRNTGRGRYGEVHVYDPIKVKTWLAHMIEKNPRKSAYYHAYVLLQEKLEGKIRENLKQKNWYA